MYRSFIEALLGPLAGHAKACPFIPPGPQPAVYLGYSASRLDSESPFFFVTLHENPAPLRQAAAAADAARGGSVRSSALLKVAAVT